MTDQPSDHGDMTDDELDLLLTTANRDLLKHIQATADPDRTLATIMSMSIPESGRQTPPAPAAQAISVRFKADRFVRALDLAHAGDRTFGSALDRDLAAALDSARVRARAIAREPDSDRDFDSSIKVALGTDRDLVVVLARARTCALESAIGITLARDLAHDLGLAGDLAAALDRARALDNALDRARALDNALDSAVAHVLASDKALASALASASDSGRDSARGRALALASALASDIDLARDLAGYLARDLMETVEPVADGAHNLARTLHARQIDASGADLSELVVEHVELLNGVIWTSQTIWPQGIAGQVSAQSEEIRPGVYLVRTGRTPDRHRVPSV